MPHHTAAPAPFPPRPAPHTNTWSHTLTSHAELGLEARLPYGSQETTSPHSPFSLYHRTPLFNPTTTASPYSATPSLATALSPVIPLHRTLATQPTPSPTPPPQLASDPAYLEYRGPKNILQADFSFCVLGLLLGPNVGLQLAGRTVVAKMHVRLPDRVRCDALDEGCSECCVIVRAVNLCLVPTRSWSDTHKRRGTVADR